MDKVWSDRVSHQSGSGEEYGDVPRMRQRSVEMEIYVYVLCGSEGCDSGAVKWSPDIVSRSARRRFGTV